MMFSSERDRFDKFTERARKVLSLTQEEAQRMQQRTMGSEHILLGLLREGEGVGARVLQNLGVELDAARKVVQSRLMATRESKQAEMVGLNPAGKMVIELAVDEARRLNHHYIGTEHLLLGLIRQDGEAIRVLEELGVNGEQIRTHTIQILSQAGAPHPRNTSEQRAGFVWHMNKRLEQGRDHFNKFDPQARKVLSLAQEEAQRFQHNYIGTEHLLLGLVRTGETSTAGQILHSLGIDLNGVRNAVEFIIGRGDRIVLGEIGLTPRAKKVIELAVDESRRLQHDHIGTEHILLGLVREGEGIAAGVLESMGVHLADVREAVLKVVGAGTPLMKIASAYVSGEKELDTRASGVQDTDDLVPETTSPEEHGNLFTLRARRVLVNAREEAQHFQRDEVGTEHLLLALIREENGLAHHVLHNLGIERERIQKATHFLINEEDLREPGKNEGLTDDGKKALELAIEESHLLGQTAIGTEHLLLGLLHSEGIASGILITRGLTLEKARAEMGRLLGL